MHSDKLKKLIELADKANAQDDRNIQGVLEVLSITWDDSLAEDIEQILMLKALPSLQDPFHPNPNLKGRFRIGSTQESWFGLTSEEINQNLLLVGRSGAGKTNLFYNIMTKFIDNNIPFLAIDFKKDYRHLIREYPDTLVIPWNAFKFNVLKPPKDTSPHIWAQTLTEVFSHSQALLSGSKNFLIDNIINLYDLYGVFEGKNNYPTFFELLEILESKKYSLVTRDASYLQVLKNRVNATILTIGKILDCETGFSFPDLLKKNVVLELDGLMDDTQNFLVEIILT